MEDGPVDPLRRFRKEHPPDYVAPEGAPCEYGDAALDFEELAQRGRIVVAHRALLVAPRMGRTESPRSALELLDQLEKRIQGLYAARVQVINRYEYATEETWTELKALKASRDALGPLPV